MVNYIEVPIRESDYAAAAAVLLQSMSSMRVEDLVAVLLGDWLNERARGNQSSVHEGRGLQWKALFLPEGSLIRTQVNGVVYAGKVIGDELVYDGRSYSPAEFANLFGVKGRNAWEHLWILFPHAVRWRHADACRVRIPVRQKK